SRAQDIGDAVVPFVTRIFINDTAFVAFSRVSDGPRPGPGAGIVERRLVEERVRIAEREPFSQCQPIARTSAAVALQTRLPVEVSRRDDQRAAIPSTACIASVSLETWAEVGAPIQRNDSHFMNHFRADSDVAG